MDDLDRSSSGMQEDSTDEYDDMEREANEMDEIDHDPAAFYASWNTRDEETSSELTADDADTTSEIENMNDDDQSDVNSVYGWVALALSIVSFFWMPIILGGAGIIVGFIARSRGAGTLGMTAIVAGAASIIISLFILPFI